MGRLPAVIVSFAALGILTAQALYAGGGLTILSQNKLDGAQNDGSAALLISQPSPYEAARTWCALLGEAPWNAAKANFNSTLAKALNYQAHQGIVAEDQVYWISNNVSDDSLMCRGIDAGGNIHHVDCQKALPSLCTQSALVSTSKSDNNSATWQVQHLVGNKVLTGYRDYHVWKFRGVRYADKPERFAYAKAASFEGSGEVNATTAGADCSQRIGEVKNGSSEDCLFANVWTPYLPQSRDAVAKPAGLKPVMLYLYGGGLTSGSSKNPNTDGTNLASRGDVVVVSVNYRVGSLGFLNFNDGVHKGNYAISDMVAALEWVNKYIKYFGGDPGKVTLFGESAGAYATHIMLGVGKAKGLFQRAIMQSSPDWSTGKGKVISYPYYDSLDRNYEGTTKVILNQAGCLNATDPTACLSKLSGFELVNLAKNANSVVMDGTYLTNQELVVNSTAGSLGTDVDVMLGITRDEVGVFIPQDDYPASNATFASYADRASAKYFGMAANLSAILGFDKRPLPGLPPALFNGTASPAQIFNATIGLFTDAQFGCFSFAKAYSAAKHAAFKSTYYFEFNRTYSPRGYTRTWCDPPAGSSPTAEYFKCHAGEQTAVFGTTLRSGAPDRDGLDVPFMQLVVDYWAAFARTGDPNPERAYLEARGYEGTAREVARAGRWERVVVADESSRPTKRLLQWDGRQVTLGEGHDGFCAALGVPMTALEPGAGIY